MCGGVLSGPVLFSRQEGRDKPRAWTTLKKYNITHMTLDDSDIGRWDVTFLNAYARRSATNGLYSVYKVVPHKYIDNPEVCVCGRRQSKGLPPSPLPPLCTRGSRRPPLTLEGWEHLAAAPPSWM